MLNIYSAAAATILSRGIRDEQPVNELQRKRTIAAFGEYLSPREAVSKILRDVELKGDEALAFWTSTLDGVTVPSERLRSNRRDIEEAYAGIPRETVDAFKSAAERILAFHKKQPALSWFDNSLGGTLGQKVVPIGRVGCYIPGGSAPLASTLLMTTLVAKAAGVASIAVASPPERKTGKIAPIILVAADIAGIDEIYVMGGAQAIGAFAYGTATVPAVDKICGPGNSFVVEAKRQVFGFVGIDSLPGPTETVVIADKTANPVWLAADFLAQAEHTGGSSILLSDSKEMIDRVSEEIEKQVPMLSTADTIRESLESRSGAVLCESIDQAISLADEYAPEHLCLSVADPWNHVAKIKRAGGIFVGEHSFEVLGDYVAGPSHTMPTGGTARFTNPCNVLDFVRVINIIGLDEKTAQEIAPIAMTMAESEGLAAHAAAARLRIGKYAR